MVLDNDDNTIFVLLIAEDLVALKLSTAEITRMRTKDGFKHALRHPDPRRRRDLLRDIWVVLLEYLNDIATYELVCKKHPGI